MVTLRIFKKVLFVLIAISLSMSVNAQGYNRQGGNNSGNGQTSLVEEAAKGVVNGVKGLFSKKKDKSDDKKKKEKKDKKGSKSKKEPLASDDTELIVTADGSTKEQATQSALRSAIEQVYGTFVSSNTTVLNDRLMKDEIVSVSTGNIKSYEYLSEAVKGGKYYVTIKAVVSIGHLISYAKSKGSATELAGSTFAMDIKMKKLNRMNAIIAYDNFLLQLKEMADDMFDYSISVGDISAGLRGYGAEATITIKSNANYKRVRDYIWNTLGGLCVTRSEWEDYERKGIKNIRYIKFCYKYQNPYPEKCEESFGEDGWYGMFELFSHVYRGLSFQSIMEQAFEFSIIDNLGGSQFQVVKDSQGYSFIGSRGQFDANDIFEMNSNFYHPNSGLAKEANDYWKSTMGFCEEGSRFPFPIGDSFSVQIKGYLNYTESELSKISKIEVRSTRHLGGVDDTRKWLDKQREEYFHSTGLK